jgi:choline monooxygenase
MNSTGDLGTRLAAFDPDLPLEQAATIPADWYTDPAWAELERRAVFAATWQAVGRADQVSGVGDYFTAEAAGVPLLVVRDEQGTLRALANVCRHRAARVAACEQGRATRFRCRYHGWTYDLQGRLRGVPEFDGVAGFRREDHRLPEYPVAVWGPLVFVRLAAGEDLTLQQHLDPLPQHPCTASLSRLRFAQRRVYDLACNWKVFVDNYLDGGYHVLTIHPSLASVLDYSRYTTQVFARTSLQLSPLRSPQADEDPSAAAVRQGSTACYWWVFPNLMLNFYEGVLDTNLVLPLGHDRCRVVFDFYFADTGAAAEAAFQRQSIGVGHQIQLEDVAICEEVQRGLASGCFQTGRYSVKRENGVHHFHRLLAQHLRRLG